ncbi:MAG: (2Fe-2S)-binding protein [Verrucomicrobiota bacterium]|nr:(2Fe-2S)-binding protein [Limisphaera sp.]MDW8381742.1 (2Fe-2S)-binding protein [Verrucomicrobiota bacterium]
MKESDNPSVSQLSRREFFKGLGTTALAAATSQAQSVAQELRKLQAEKVFGPGAVPVTLHVNGKIHRLEVEPRVTLLDALRNHLGLTGSKEGCDRASCGACTVWLDGRAIYACQKLAIDSQGHEITTIEGLAPNGQLTPVQRAFVDRDALQCGYCTPGFVMSVSALLRKKPQPTPEEVIHACAGNICRCGTHPRIVEAALIAAGRPAASTPRTEVISYG